MLSEEWRGGAAPPPFEAAAQHNGTPTPAAPPPPPPPPGSRCRRLWPTARPAVVSPRSSGPPGVRVKRRNSTLAGRSDGHLRLHPHELPISTTFADTTIIACAAARSAGSG